jgi:[glutamine synthetase] adenylyltransferase / [glutamine synthetase]-adenylyl-L-tyrosine phosphorylase
MDIHNLIHETAAGTPDPARALKNLERLFRESPDFAEKQGKRLRDIGLLFAYSQFLADHCIMNPKKLASSLKDIKKTFGKNEMLKVRESPEAVRLRSSPLRKQEMMRYLRDIKKHYLLRITLRDVIGISGLDECMSELSMLAEAVLEIALDMSFALMREKFGDMKDESLSIIGLGKLGAEELNYSSDIDIISVYRAEEQVSSGVKTPSGVRANRIGSHEYFCRLTEILTGLLHTPTEDGIAYRVDLRLRPNGQKGALSLPLNSYLSYYEAWGKTWERLAMIRAKHAAGDEKLGESFIDAIHPFVWKRSLDYNDIEEIRELKKKIDTISDTNDIKRGYGGIREIEFFVQTFQLLYGGDRANLRKGRLPSILESLHSEGFLSENDIKTLTESYFFLRRIEHILQMKDDLQMYVLPAQSPERDILAKKMRFRDEKEFMSDLQLKRLKVRDMYSSLLGGASAAQKDLLSLKDELPDAALRDYLSFKGFRNPDSAIKNITALQEQITTGKTMRERSLLRKTVPAFFEEVFRSTNKDRALGMLVTLLEKIGCHASYIDMLLQRNDTRQIVVRIFSASEYLTRMLMGRDNLEGIFEYPDIRMDYASVLERLINMLGTNDPMKSIREFKAVEELKTGMLFLGGFIDIYGLMHTLSMLADMIIRSVIKHLRADKGFAVIGLGGFGAKELNIGSDLDLMFINAKGPHKTRPPETARDSGFAEELLRYLTEYMETGVAYKVDMRLRPDGSKGILVNDLEGYKAYYMKSAQSWEIQALLRARPVAGDLDLIREFHRLRKDLLILRGGEISGLFVQEMRGRIISELSRESAGYDIRLGPGGIKEIEFLVQYLQLSHLEQHPALSIQNTLSGIKKLVEYSILDRGTGDMLLKSHRFLRNVDTFLRLNEEDVLKTNSEIPDIISTFLNLKSRDDLIRTVENTRQQVVEITKKFYT